MKIKLTFLLVLTSLFFLSSCDDEPQAPESATGVQKETKGAIDVVLSEVTSPTGIRLLHTEKTIYDLSGNITGVIKSDDTIPSLGSTTDTLDTGRTLRNSDDEDEEVDTVVVHPKTYSYYFTVKAAK